MNHPKESPKTTNIDDGLDDETVDEGSKYLLFRLDGEMYGTPLLGVREVIQPQATKAIPNTAPYFMGLINVRGQIIGVVDLRARFDYTAIDVPSMAFLIFETDIGPIAAIVDKVEAVIKIEEDNFHKKPNIRSQVPVEFFMGATTFEDQLVTLIDLNKTLSKEDYVKIQQSKIGVAS